MSKLTPRGRWIIAGMLVVAALFTLALATAGCAAPPDDASDWTEVCVDEVGTADLDADDVRADDRLCDLGTHPELYRIYYGPAYLVPRVGDPVNALYGVTERPVEGSIGRAPLNGGHGVITRRKF